MNLLNFTTQYSLEIPKGIAAKKQWGVLTYEELEFYSNNPFLSFEVRLAKRQVPHHGRGSLVPSLIIGENSIHYKSDPALNYFNNSIFRYKTSKALSLEEMRSIYVPAKEVCGQIYR